MSPRSTERPAVLAIEPVSSWASNRSNTASTAAGESTGMGRFRHAAGGCAGAALGASTGMAGWAGSTMSNHEDSRILDSLRSLTTGLGTSFSNPCPKWVIDVGCSSASEIAVEDWAVTGAVLDPRWITSGGIGAGTSNTGTIVGVEVVDVVFAFNGVIATVVAVVTVVVDKLVPPLLDESVVVSKGLNTKLPVGEWVADRAEETAEKLAGSA